MVEAVINYWAVIVAALVSMILGMLWYSPGMFGNVWMRLSKLSKKDIDAEKSKGMGGRYFLGFVGAFIMSFVLAHFVDYAEATTFSGGLQAGGWIWLGFIATTMLGMVLWEGKSWKLYCINSGYYLVSLLINGGILAVW